MNYFYTNNRCFGILLVIFLLFLNRLPVYAQETIVSGTVMNEENQRVPGAEIRMGQVTAKSNAQGIFTLRIGKFPVQLSIKHPLYNEYLEVVRPPVTRSDTLFLTLFLEAKATQLEEVTVSTSRIFRVYEKNNTHIIDFTISGKEIMLVCRENNRYFLRRLDSIGKKIVDLPIRKNPTGLFEDCTGGTHLVYTDSIFEIKLIRNSIGLLSGRTYLETMHILAPCIISSEHNFIVKRLGPHNKLVEYTKIDWNTKKPSRLYLTSDRKEMRSLDDFALENDIPVPLSNPNFKRGNQPNTLTDKQKWDNQQLYNQILTKPLYAPIFEINDSVFVFDHFKDSAIVFTLNGQYVRSFQISYHYFDNWKSELFLNEEKTKIYARYETEGLVTLREINPSTGKVMNLTVLEQHIHPIHIQVRGNFAYYLYKHYLDTSIHYLYKQPLRE